MKGDDGYAWITDMDSLDRQRLSTKQSSVVAAKWLAYSQASGVIWLVTGGSDGTLKIWRKGGRETDFKLWRSTAVFKTSIEDISVSGRNVVVVGGGGLQVYELMLMAQQGTHSFRRLECCRLRSDKLRSIQPEV